MNSELEKLIQERVVELVIQRNKFVENAISKHCYWWQKIYLRLAKKFKLKVWFCENIIQEMPHELNSDYMGLYFQSERKYGIKINGKIYWIE